MFCRNCGSNCPDGSAVCSNCGAALSAVPTPAYVPVKPAVPGNGMGVASLVLGIISLISFCVWYISIPCGIIALALGGVAKSKASQVGLNNSLATAGVVCSCIAIGLAAVFILLVLAGLANLGLI